jgi:cation:H+ antiporter
MLFAIIQFVVLAAVIIAAGTMLARYADGIAEATGLGRLLIGSVLLAGATSLPELTVDISAVRLNLPDMAMGDLLGSSLMNLLILAALDLTHYSGGKMLSRTAAAHALSGLFSIALTGIVGLGLLTSRKAEHWTFLGVHAWVWVVALGYGLGVRMVFLDQRIATRTAEEQGALPEHAPHPMPLWKAALGFLIAALVIVLTGPFLAHAAGRIAELSGLGNTFVGTTLVALCTSLPELSASYAAIRIGAVDLAVGNVFGSNAFNMLLFLPLDFAFPGALFAAVSPAHTISAFAVIVASSVVIIGQLYHVERRTRFLEPDAIAVMIIIIAALAMIYYTG